MDQFFSKFPLLLKMTWRYLAMSLYNYPISHQVTCSNTNNSQLQRFINFIEKFHQIFMAWSAFRNLLYNTLIKIRSKKVLRCHLFLVHSHWLDVSYAIRRVIFSSFLGFFSFWTTKILAKYDEHHHQ